MYDAVHRVNSTKTLSGNSVCSTTACLYLATAEIYDPRLDVWQPTNPMHQGRYEAGAALLPNGNVLVVGGAATSIEGSVTDVLASAEIYEKI